MKKYVLAFLFCFALTSLAQANASSTDDFSVKVKQELEQYKTKCFNDVAFPKELSNYNMYNDDIKKGDFRYHQCLKEIIIQKIKQNSSEDDIIKMTNALNLIQEGTLELYWTIYNRQDNGTIGRGMNDAVLGRRFEDILEDIIHYQYVYEND